MKIMRIAFELGNAMFCYATYLQLKKLYPGESVLIDITHYKWSKFKYELEDVFGIKAHTLYEILDATQKKILENELSKLDFPKYFKFDNLNHMANSLCAINGSLMAPITCLSYVEIPNAFNKAGLNFKIVSDPKLNLEMEDIRRIYNTGKYRIYPLQDFISSRRVLYYPARLIVNKNVRKEFISDILALKKPDFNGYEGLERLLSDDDTYYNIYGNPNDCIGVREQLLKDFTFPNITDEANLRILQKIQSTNSIAMHIRVGCYNYGMAIAVRNRHFIKSVKYIKRKIENPNFFIFSDNIAWCKENLDILGLRNNDIINFVDNNKGSESYRDMQLMSLCKHNILSNSTFGWWGAFLNQNRKKIVSTPCATLPGTISF